MELVYSIDNVIDFDILKTNPPTYFVNLEGSTRQGGWSNGQLVPHVYVVPPSDGFLEVDFVADPPIGPSTHVLTSIDAKGLFGHEEWLRGFRILSETNAVELYIIRKEFEDRFDELDRFPWSADLIEDGEGPGDAQVVDDAEIFSNHISLVSDEAVSLEGRQQCIEKKLFTISSFPETKTEWVTKCVLKIAGKCVTKTKIPQIYRRTSKIVVFAKLCWPDGDDIRNEVEDCFKQAIAAGVLAGVVTGNLAAAEKAAYAYLVACLKSKGIKAANDISIRLSKKKIAGKWKKL